MPEVALCSRACMRMPTLRLTLLQGFVGWLPTTWAVTSMFLLRLPIVTLLHGVYGSHWSWAYQGGAHLTAAELMRQGSICPMVLVMPMSPALVAA